MLWDKKGKLCTEETIELALNKARELNCTHIVVASNSGYTANLLVNQGLQVVCVTHHVGFSGPGIDEMSESTRMQLQNAGAQVLTSTHLFAGVDRAVRLKFGGVYPTEIIAQTLRLFGQGVKVAIEVAIMALDAGLIPYGQEVISIGGTAKGADAAVVIRPAHSNNFFDTQVGEIICRPRNA